MVNHTDPKVHSLQIGALLSPSPWCPLNSPCSPVWKPSSESEVNYVTYYFRNAGELWSNADVHHADCRTGTTMLGERAHREGRERVYALLDKSSHSAHREDGNRTHTTIAEPQAAV